MFAGNFAPIGWAFCDGQLLAVSQNDALFSLLGTIYGGDGRTTFGLPDLRGRIPVHQGTGAGLSARPIGSNGGAEDVTIGTSEMPVHNHPLQATTGPGADANPAGKVTADSPSVKVYIEDPPSVSLASATVANSGGSQSHRNLQPFLCINFIIALSGLYPSAS
jgi:microcystin-dependent protein